MLLALSPLLLAGWQVPRRDLPDEQGDVGRHFLGSRSRG